MMDQMMQAFMAAVIAVLIVGALAGCVATPDMSREEAINIVNLANTMEKPDEKVRPKSTHRTQQGSSTR